MWTLLVIAAIAAVIRLATATDPALTAVVVGLIAASAAVYGLWTNGRAHWKGWRWSWGLITMGLIGHVAGAIFQGVHSSQALPEAMWTLGITGASNLVAIVGLVLVIHQRMPGQWAESLSTAIVAIASLCFPVLSLAVVPNLGWHPGQELLPIAVPVLSIVMVWLCLSLISLTERHPVSYRYLVGGFICQFAAYATGAAMFLAGQQSSPVPLNSLVLWGACLWSCAILHHSQRQALDPVPFRSTRPTWPHMLLMVVGALVVPGVVGAKLALHMPLNATLLMIGSGTVPLLVVAFLLYQVFARAEAEYRAQHDPLTGVCNRVLFNDRLDTALFDAQRSGRPLAVMFLDLDRFKSINDSLGHAVGNQLLQAVVKRVQGRLRPKDTLARMGGDEFTILFPDLEGKESGVILAERMLAAFSEPFCVGGKLLPMQASIGVAVHPEDGEDGESLFKNADTAMYHAKAAGRNTYAIYDTVMSAKAELRFALETNLRSSLERGHLTVHYQPKLTTSGDRVTGVEALARWEHPHLGFIPPSAFIPLAEETSLIATLGEWVLETACVQARTWQQHGLPRFTVAVNVSPRQFMRQSVVRMVADVLNRTGLDPTLLELEVTESVLVEHMQDTAASLAELRAMGVRCSIDDFGTGYSALKYLAEMPVDSIKIDPSFIARIDSDTGAAPIVGAVIALAHSLNLEVVAEGVETVSQLEFLSAHDCDKVQGFLFSPPVPATEIARIVENPAVLQRKSGVDEADDLDQVHLISPARLAAVFDGVNATGEWVDHLDNDDFLAVIGALQPEDLVLIAGARGARVFPARMALGTLAGLASVTGTLGAAGALPAAPALAGELLRAAGAPVHSQNLTFGSDGSAHLVADSTFGTPSQAHLTSTVEQGPAIGRDRNVSLSGTSQSAPPLSGATPSGAANPLAPTVTNSVPPSAGGDTPTGPTNQAPPITSDMPASSDVTVQPTGGSTGVPNPVTTPPANTGGSATGTGSGSVSITATASGNRGKKGAGNGGGGVTHTGGSGGAHGNGAANGGGTGAPAGGGGSSSGQGGSAGGQGNGAGQPGVPGGAPSGGSGSGQVSAPGQTADHAGTNGDHAPGQTKH